MKKLIIIKRILKYLNNISLNTLHNKIEIMKTRMKAKKNMKEKKKYIIYICPTRRV
jgi:hypothetical protein